MSNNEYTVTLKTNQDTWIVVHADDSQTLHQMLDELDGDLLAKIVSNQGHFQAARNALEVLPSGAVPAPVSVPAAPVPAPAPAIDPNTAVYQQQPQQAAPPAFAQPVPQTQPVAVPAPMPAAAGLPASVQIWEAPGSNPQYVDLWVKFPYIADAATRNDFNGRLKATGIKFFDGDQKAWHGKRDSRPQVEALFQQFAHLFG